MGWLTEAVIVQILATVGVVLAGGIPAYMQLKTRLQAIGKDASEARRQTQNDHSTNLRDELDERHEVILEAVRDVAMDVRGLRIDHLATRKDIGQLRADDRNARKETSELRRELQRHIDDTGPFMPVIEKIVRLYALHERKQGKSGPDNFPEDIHGH